MLSAFAGGWKFLFVVVPLRGFEIAFERVCGPNPDMYLFSDKDYSFAYNLCLRKGLEDVMFVLHIENKKLSLIMTSVLKIILNQNKILPSPN